MRLYTDPAMGKLFSQIMALIAIAIAAFVGYKAWGIWTADPALNQIPQILNGSPADQE